ncbi:MAG: hypothetical protein AAFN93_24750 [Bacteroidota bacterium]
MKLKDKISLKSFEDKRFRLKMQEVGRQGEAAFTHYLHNHTNGVSQYFREAAIEYVGNLLAYQQSEESIDF